MGSIVDARCECGFDTESMFLGGGFVSFMTLCRAPALCSECMKMVVANYLEDHQVCDACGGELVF